MITPIKQVNNPLPLTPEQFVEMDVCPICKRLVKINRHSKQLCERIELNKIKIQKTADNIKIQKTADNALKKANRLNKSEQC